MYIVQEVEADIELLKVSEGSGVEPVLDLSGFLGVPFFRFVDENNYYASACAESGRECIPSEQKKANGEKEII